MGGPGAAMESATSVASGFRRDAPSPLSGLGLWHAERCLTSVSNGFLHVRVYSLLPGGVRQRIVGLTWGWPETKVQSHRVMNTGNILSAHQGSGLCS